MNEYPKVGQFLHSTCSASDYGRIIARGKYQDDENEQEYDTIDILINDPNDLIDSSFVEQGMQVQVYVKESLALCSVRYSIKSTETDPWDATDAPGIWIQCDTPGNGCFRCKKLFRLRDAQGTE